MKIYFAGSIRGGRDDQELYKSVIATLSRYGTVLTEHISDKNLSAMGESLSSEYIYERDVEWLAECDVVVAEVTTPSLGVGYEMEKGEGLDKKILCLYRPAPERKLSAMIVGNKHVTVCEYRSVEELEKALAQFFG